MTAIPPNLPSAELELLGTMLTDRAAVDVCAGIIQPGDMYSTTHSKTYAAILSVYEEGAEPDVINVGRKLPGMDAKLVEMQMAAGSMANVAYNARFIKQLAILRQIQSLGITLTKAASDTLADPFALISSAGDKLSSMLSSVDAGASSMPSKELVHLAAEEIDAAARGEFKRRCIPTGYTKYDFITNGWMKKRLIIIAGRPSMGKTSFAVNCAINIGKAKRGVGFFSLEQSKEELMIRMLCRECGMKYNDVQAGRVHTTRASLTDGMKALAEANIVIDDGSGLTYQQIRARTQRMIRTYGTEGIVIDYLGLMNATSARSRDEEVGIITKNLKGMAKDLDIFVVLLSQLNRNLETRKDKRPTLADLRESGNIEQDADDVVFVHRPEYYDSEDQPGIAELIVSKQRNGETGKATLNFIKEHMRFENQPPPGFDSLVPPPEREEGAYRGGDDV